MLASVVRSSPLRTATSTTTQFLKYNTAKQFTQFQFHSTRFYTTQPAMSNVYFDIQAGGEPLGRIVLYLHPSSPLTLPSYPFVFLTIGSWNLC